MDETTIRAAVEAERLGLWRLVEGLDRAGWSVPSLRAEWTVGKAIGNLTTTWWATGSTAIPARVAGARRTATDVDWSFDEGEEIRGRAIDLLLVSTGRGTGLDGLAGSGVALLPSRLS